MCVYFPLTTSLSQFRQNQLRQQESRHDIDGEGTLDPFRELELGKLDPGVQHHSVQTRQGTAGAMPKRQYGRVIRHVHRPHLNIRRRQ